VLEPFRQQLARVRLRPPEMRWVSNLTGTWIRPEEATDPEYWLRHLRRPVRLGDGVAALADVDGAALLEVGPGRGLATLCRRHPALPAGRPVVASLPDGRNPEDEVPDLLHALGRLWVAGVEPDWQGLHDGERRRRVTLPTYPFERRRHWIERAAAAPAAGTARDSAGRRPLAEWFQVPSWQRLPRPRPRAEAAGEARRWLLFTLAEGLGAALAAALAGRGDEVVRVLPGDRFARRDGGSFQVRPESAGDFDALLRALDEEGGRPARMVHLWIADAAAGAGDASSHQSIERLGFGSLLHLVQALGRAGGGGEGEIELAVVARGLAAVDPGDETVPAAALATGPALVAGQELAGLFCRVIDVAGGAGEEPALARRLVAELAAAPQSEVVALRGERRLLRRYETVELGELREDGRPPLRRRGTYLVTGGLGGIGLRIAAWLAREAAARLVLIGRSPFPPRERWPEIAGEAHPDGDRARALLELEAAGAEVLVASADVADEAALAAALEAARRRFGPIHGLFHAAGAAGGGLLVRQSAESMRPVLAPKVRGTLLLDGLLAGDPLELIVLVSSTFGITGGVGRVDYVAANAFLDAFAHRRAARGGPLTVALDFYGWEDVGMAREAPRRAARAAANGAAGNGAAGEGAPIHPLLGAPAAGADGAEEFHVRLAPDRHWVLAEHRLLGRPVMPGTALLEAARAALSAASGDGAARRIELREAAFLAPLAVAEGEEREVRTVLAGGAGEGGERAFRILGRRDDGGWQVHASGRGVAIDGPEPAAVDLGEIRRRCTETGALPAAGSAAADGGERLASWGPRWEVLRGAWSGAGEGLVELELPERYAADLGTFPLHPALLDVATASGLALAGRTGHLPFSYRRLRFHAPLSTRLWAHVRWPAAGAGGFGGAAATFDVTLADDAGRVLVEVDGFTARPVAGTRLAEAAAEESARDGARRSSRRASGRAIRPDEGIEALARALASGLGPQIAISPVGLAELRAEQERARETLERRAARPAEERGRHPRPNLGVPFAAPESELERLVTGLWEELLGIERVGLDDNFFELGGHSLLAVELASRLRGELRVEVPLDRVFERPTVRALVRLVVEVITQAADESDLSRALAELELESGLDAEAVERSGTEATTEVGNG
jgi:acyl transferase domain-containing protein